VNSPQPAPRSGGHSQRPEVFSVVQLQGVPHAKPPGDKGMQTLPAAAHCAQLVAGSKPRGLTQVIKPTSLITQAQFSGQLEHAPMKPAHRRSTQSPLAHCLSLVHFLPASLSLGAASAIPGMEASTPPTKAAPISLSALPRERVPLESPTASSSKERSLASGDIGSPFGERVGLAD
jgi:hypothetical protein